jgi:serine protease inhibitor
LTATFLENQWFSFTIKYNRTMRIKLLFLAGLSALGLGLLAVTGCRTEAIEQPGPDPIAFDCKAKPAALQTFAGAHNEFGFNIFKQLHKVDAGKNLFVSPLSIETAFGMLLNGAKGASYTQTRDALQLGKWPQAEINQNFGCLLAKLPAADKKVKLQIANSIWHEQTFQVLPEFLDVNKQYFDSEVAGLNFRDPKSLDVINGWVKTKTQGLIPDILKEIPSNAVMYLINAVYFKAPWKQAFDPKYTAKQGFSTPDGTVQTDMMSRGETRLPYFETEQFQAVDLPYGDSTFTMSIFLPKRGQNVEAVVDALNTKNWNAWVGTFKYQPVFFKMPRFKMSYEKTLNDFLITLGMRDIFGPRADLSGINGSGGLQVSKVLHKSFVEVNEAGTEAAAVTSIEIIKTSVPTIPFFIADRPFVFAIRERTTGSVVFLGKVMNPNQG